MSLIFKPEEALYHGTLDIYEKILKEKGPLIIPRGNDMGVDFGWGFYLTTNKQQAIELARDRLKYPVAPKGELAKLLQEVTGMTSRDFIQSHESFKPIVLEYRIKDAEKWEDYYQQLSNRKLIFTKDSINWKRYVNKMRQTKEIPEDIDWVFGPVADGGLFENPRAIPGMNQLSLHNMVAIEMLELVTVWPC